MNEILMQAPAGGNQIIPQLVMFGSIFVVFYFFMLRPQQKKAKEQKEFINNLKAGDWVVTMGGLHGKIITLSDLEVVLEVDKSTRLTYDRSALSADGSKRLQNSKSGS